MATEVTTTATRMIINAYCCYVGKLASNSDVISVGRFLYIFS